MKKLSIYIFLVLMWCTISYSNEGLKNIYYFDLVVEKVKDNECGVTKENIEREVKYVLANSPIKLKKDIFIEAIYISPTIINNGSYCSGFAFFEIWLGGNNKNSAGVKYFGKEVSYNKGYIYTSSVNRFKNGYLEVINDLTKSFIVAWKEVN